MLIAIDEKETSLKALHYVGRMAADIEGLTILLLHVYSEPPPDFYQRGGSLDTYRTAGERYAEKLFAKAHEVLARYGIEREQINRMSLMAEGMTISDAVLSIRKQGKYGTVVVGKRGVSKAEEFLFGSISNALAKNSKGFSAWIVG